MRWTASGPVADSQPNQSSSAPLVASAAEIVECHKVTAVLAAPGRGVEQPAEARTAHLLATSRGRGVLSD